MSAPADKTKVPNNKSRAIANSFTQQEKRGDSSFQFIDNRPESITQRNLQEIANKSPQAKKAAQLQEMANHALRQRQAITYPKNLFRTGTGRACDVVDYSNSLPFQLQSVQKTKRSSGSVIQKVGFSPQELGEQIQEKLGGAGICNALTAAWLAGQLDVSSEDGTTGVTEKNWDWLVALKNLLDCVILKMKTFPSGMISLALLPYLKSKENEWLANLPNLKLKLENESKAFIFWFNRKYKPPRKKADTTVKGLYNTLAEIIYANVDAFFENNFGLTIPFQGVIEIKATHSKTAISKGHEFAISYTPDENSDGGQFAIYDQNSGLTQIIIIGYDEVVEALSEYIINNYINNPIPDTDTAEFNILLYSK